MWIFGRQEHRMTLIRGRGSRLCIAGRNNWLHCQAMNCAEINLCLLTVSCCAWVINITSLQNSQASYQQTCTNQCTQTTWKLTCSVYTTGGRLKKFDLWSGEERSWFMSLQRRFKNNKHKKWVYIRTEIQCQDEF